VLLTDVLYLYIITLRDEKHQINEFPQETKIIIGLTYSKF